MKQTGVGMAAESNQPRGRYWHISLIGALNILVGCQEPKAPQSEERSDRATTKTPTKIDIILECPLNISDAFLEGSKSPRTKVETLEFSFSEIPNKKNDTWGPGKITNAKIKINNIEYNANLTYFDEEYSVINYSYLDKYSIKNEVKNITYFIDMKKNIVVKTVASMIGYDHFKTSVNCRRLEGAKI